jgi:hypothetical protein
MKLTVAQRRVLAALAEFNIRIGPGTLGQRVWGKPHVSPQAYAMTCGKMLHTLEDLGLVRWDTGISSYDMYGWEITAKGRRALEESKPSTKLEEKKHA